LALQRVALQQFLPWLWNRREVARDDALWELPDVHRDKGRSGRVVVLGTRRRPLRDKCRSDLIRVGVVVIRASTEDLVAERQEAALAAAFDLQRGHDFKPRRVLDWRVDDLRRTADAHHGLGRIRRNREGIDVVIGVQRRFDDLQSCDTPVAGA
jgi:hypothetical protein